MIYIDIINVICLSLYDYLRIDRSENSKDVSAWVVCCWQIIKLNICITRARMRTVQCGEGLVKGRDGDGSTYNQHFQQNYFDPKAGDRDPICC